MLGPPHYFKEELMNNIQITVEINGQQHKIEDCSWYFISPCGCTSGVMTCRDYENGGWLTSAEQAHASWTPKRSVREQDQKRGERLELGLHGEVKERLSGECPHTPKWGNPVIPEGAEWGHADGQRTVHVVPMPENNHERRTWTSPLCNPPGRDYYEIRPSVRGDWPMCKKCLELGAAA